MTQNSQDPAAQPQGQQNTSQQMSPEDLASLATKFFGPKLQPDLERMFALEFASASEIPYETAAEMFRLRGWDLAVFRASLKAVEDDLVISLGALKEEFARKTAEQDMPTEFVARCEAERDQQKKLLELAAMLYQQAQAVATFLKLDMPNPEPVVERSVPAKTASATSTNLGKMIAGMFFKPDVVVKPVQVQEPVSQVSGDWLSESAFAKNEKVLSAFAIVYNRAVAVQNAGKTSDVLMAQLKLAGLDRAGVENLLKDVVLMVREQRRLSEETLRLVDADVAIFSAKFALAGKFQTVLERAKSFLPPDASATTLKG